ncbi:MAG: response regulator [Acidobacteria bacterium]|nr:response regulator [Acidobacteriota bacterium]
MKPKPSTTLAIVGLRVEQDLVSLRRRTRVAADKVGLDRTPARGLAAAAYEVGRQLSAHRRDVVAVIRRADGPSLQVIFRITATADEAAELSARIEAAMNPLGALVDRLALDAVEGGLSVCLMALLPLGAVQRNGAIDEAEETQSPATKDPPTLQDHVRELQAELEETNRGVVALYAELEGQTQRMRRAEDRVRMLLDLDGVEDYAICMLTPGGDIESWNAGAARLFGYEADEIIGRNVDCFYAPSDCEADLPAEDLRAARSAGRHESEGIRIRRGGSAFDAHVLVTPVRDSRQALRGFSLVVRDVTERKRMEDDLRRRAEELAAANRAKEDFLATLSHELRTPLNAMLGWTRLLRMGKLDAEAQERALETIERNAHAQEQLIADILDVSRIVTGKLRLDLRPIDLPPIIDAALDAVRPTANAKGVQLRCAMHFTGTVLGDPDRLQQVVWNLLANAIKFTPPGGQVAVALARVGPNLVITVTDSGEGIGARFLPFIFDRFMQADASVTRPHGGLGLGLSIVRHIIELHGGKVHAWSEGPGHGSTFTVHLPVRAVQHAEVPHPGQPSLSGVKVLVVDDDADARQVVSATLSGCGAETMTVESARAAMQVLEEFQPDVLVSDISMPGEDGYTLIRRVRALGPALNELPAVALSGFAHPEEQRRALTAGYHSFVPKPVEVAELTTVVRRLADRRAPPTDPL